jgi:methionine-rich copper-binding protein CopC
VAGRRLTGVHLVVAVALVAAAVVVPTVALSGSASAADPCAAPVQNPVACENTQPGTPNWQVDSDDPSIAGFTTDISSTAGGQVQFKVDTAASSYDIFIFRLGYYQGIGARQVADLQVRTKTTQPSCKVDPDTAMTDCGNWAVTATWNVPTTAVSGLYYAVFHRNDTSGENEAAFVIRDDGSHSDVLFQTSDETWEAYNSYGGDSLYTGSGPGTNGASFAVSYNRPLSGEGDENFIFNAEVPMLYFMEEQGYDVSYTTDVDSARNGALIKNHKVFMTVGHDEYWSNEQRANVTAAMDAGVNMSFMTGNDSFWKTRFAPSIDGSDTAWRSVICYKETQFSAKVDPTSTWTGTWRDPRFSPPADGGRPENAFVGQMFQMNGYRSDSLQVPAAYGKMRLWRNTALATATPGSTYTFQPGTLGYEWDTVQDNGFQPAGVAELSKTTVSTTGNFVLNNYGDGYGPGTLTHNLTMYRDAVSHSLVFAAGDVQWAWGLADDHAFQTDTPTHDVRMQQATVNLMADMGVRPSSLMAGLTAATASTDTSAPTVAITTAPTPVVGANYSFSGTVSDVGGGQVAGVEASSDAGHTWHYATWTAGTGTWSYNFVPSAVGSVTVEVRAVDDSANLSSPVAATLTVGQRSCPCGVFADSSAPAHPSTTDDSNLELGMKFQSSESGFVTGVRFYKGDGNTGTHTGTLWTADGTKLASGTFTNETASGWQTMTFARSVPVQANTTYVVSYHAPNGHYAGDNNYFTDGPAILQPMTGLQGGTTPETANGVFSIGPTAFPTDSFQNTNYYVDPVFNTVAAPNIQPPNVLANDPVDGTGSVTLNPTIDVTFDEPVVQSSLQFTVSGSAGTVAGTVSLSADRTTATFTPSAALAASTKYTVSAKATDDSGNVMPTAFTWSFTTGKPRPAACPCSIWDDFTTPAIADSGDTSSVTVGTKVRFDTKGQVTGVRFYKGPNNGGTHVGSLYSSTGTLLESGTFTGETASGWQTLTFASPVNVNANTTYVVAYFAPQGHYSASPGYFGNNTATFNQLHAIADGVDGGNGVYMYGAGSTFPTNTYNANNYWVDVLWQQGANGDSAPPTVSATSPAGGATGASLTTHLTATMNEAVDLGSANFTLTDAGGAALTGTTTLSADQQTLTFTPSSALAPGTSYTGSVQAADVNGNTMSTPTKFTFTTTTTATCPCSMFSAATVPTVVNTNDPNPYELGVKFAPAGNGTITGVKFYKGSQNTGPHTGNLYTSTGTLLATGTFTGETASGWQTLTFSAPVAVTAGTTYVASYTTTTGFYSGDNGYFNRTGVTTPALSSPQNVAGTPNGVFHSGGAGFPTDTFGGSNYWVDVVFAS